MRYSLFRDGDAAGDSGMMSVHTSPETGRPIKDTQGQPPAVGFGLRVGTPFARTFEPQDWWQCTPVTEILSTSGRLKDGEIEVRFRTRNSTYTWRAF